MPSPRAAGFVTVFTEHRAADFWLEGHGIMATAIVADDLKTLWRILPRSGLLRTAFRTPLRLHHISLVKDLLIFFAKDKNIFALNTRDFDIRHRFSSSYWIVGC